MMTILEFEVDLRDALVAELEHWRSRMADDTMRAFNLGCHPWHGYIEPSFLTGDESVDIPVDRIWEDIGSWRVYNFTLARDSEWPQVIDISRWMQEEWTQAVSRADMAETFFRVFASVVMSGQVVRTLQTYRLSDDFQVGVFDTDHPRLGNFCTDWKELVRGQGGHS